MKTNNPQSLGSTTGAHSSARILNPKSRIQNPKYVLALPLILACACNSPVLKPTATIKKQAHDHWTSVRADVKLRLAQSEFAAGHLDDAQREGAAALELDPANLNAHALIIRIWLERGRLSQAKHAVRQAMQHGPDDPEIAYLAGIVAEREEDWAEALTQYTRASDRVLTNADYLAARAETLVALDRAAEAVDLIESRLENFDDDAPLRALAAHIYNMLGLDRSAAERWRQAARSDAESPADAEDLAMGLAAAGRDIEAVGLLEPIVNSPDNAATFGGSVPASPRAGAIKPVRTAPALTLARSYHRLGRLTDARRCISNILMRHPREPSAWLLLARVAMDGRDWPAARDAAEQAVALDETRVESHLLLAAAALQQKDFGPAESAARRALALDDREPTAWCLLGQAAEALGEFDEARRAYVSALRSDADCALARALLERLIDNAAKTTPPAPIRNVDAREKSTLPLTGQIAEKGSR